MALLFKRARRLLGRRAFAYSGDPPLWPAGRHGVTKQYYDVMDPFVTLTAAAAVTTRLELATGVCLVIQRDSIQTANRRLHQRVQDLVRDCANQLVEAQRADVLAIVEQGFAIVYGEQTSYWFRARDTHGIDLVENFVASLDQVSKGRFLLASAAAGTPRRPLWSASINRIPACSSARTIANSELVCRRSNLAGHWSRIGVVGAPRA